MLIGNDLIDLQSRDASGKARDGRFIRRVFTPGEAARIEASIDPDRTLWMLWAGKEAAYKVARKLRPGVLFAHGAYEVMPAASMYERDALPVERLDGYVRLRGIGGLDGLCFPVEWKVTTSFVHCIAVERDAGSSHPLLWTAIATHEEAEGGSDAYEPSERERASARSAESRSVRRLARVLARKGGLGEVEIVREPAGKTLGPPRLFRVGEAEQLDGWDISLSHDGSLAAVVLSGPPTSRS